MGSEAGRGGRLDPGLAGCLERLARRLAGRRGLGLKSLVVFGSRARGGALGESDVDVVVVAEGFEGLPFYEREYVVLREWDCPWALEAWCYTPGEAREGVLARPRIDLVDAVEHGIVVYDDGFWEGLKREYEALGGYEWVEYAPGMRGLRLPRRRRGGRRGAPGSP